LMTRLVMTKERTGTGRGGGGRIVASLMCNSNQTTYESTKTEINSTSVPCYFLYFPACSLRTLQTVSRTWGKALRYSHYLH
jgi:hypothetical protein